MVKQLLHITLSVVLLIGTAGMVVNKHYSNGELYSASLFGEAKSCCADDELCSCCSTETEFYQVEDDFNNSSFQLPDIVCLQSFFGQLYNVSKNEQIPFSTSTQIRHQSHEPPEIEEFLSLIQVFLI